MNFDNLKKNEQGLVPVITQDYITNEVLMLAYMNEEAFYKTLETGKVYYYSRSRQSLWLKGGTSGHYQHVKYVKLDCDKDTLLIKVKQEGAACHTGNKTCFFTEVESVWNEEVDSVNNVLTDVYDVIVDRKENPKEGSYTNYLLEKGIDKILKKVGEETAEVIIGAKNEGNEEVVYEISDLIYHLSVLMVEKDVNWNDILKELSKRR
ncbi:phosphoribosyl-ATP pyrophosphatase /phosphoribosyl-AMP cyclohydrolase [Natranaerovirga hydrolytica]|uniref:Histidine biosynthesis bifunctional protein HisIE n=1 Tax=Natranaerovirga hydrolytica TaxID=680378 RepID=A0A4R1N5J6_9FIRM|nr:bifunctional phosphoribosyl-AMP cyclohydrolase/phosphoribosyl-ATP diphosphatase HisIE [Natranaerovirga hydrolytica]TCK98259.1 phosphoribosyl-ATP pyrophosphatase /phosphoribosyl-AMP cyclohydrolase [Natranaerovirga hydrolytica]